MTPVFQTITEPGRGNCLAACFASILDVEIEDIPDLKCGNDLSGLSDLGISFTWVRSPEEFKPLGHCILIGQSPRNPDINHAVVGEHICFGFEIVHDPHPDGGGIDGEIKSIIYLGAPDA